MDSFATLRAKYPALPGEYFQLLGDVGGWEGFVGDSYVVLFDATAALSATEEYELPIYRPGYFALGSNGGGELLVCASSGIGDRSVYHLPAVGMSDGPLIEVASSFREFGASVLAAARGGDA